MTEENEAWDTAENLNEIASFSDDTAASETISDDSGFIFPDSSERMLTEEELASLDSTYLRLARNEIFARYGYIFNSEDIQQYFSEQAWYVPDPLYDGALSEVEEYNVDLIKQEEAKYN